MMTQVSPGTLYIVATPIGNLGDITHRGVEVLSQVDLIAAEDTRHTKKLLQHLGIQGDLFALHDHNEKQKAQVLVERLKQGQSVALVSDAGTPLISDPGYALVNACREQGLVVSPIPGACAAISALSVSGLPSNRFSFEGFLPAKSKARQDTLSELAADPRTLIFYESPRRVLDTVKDIAHTMGEERELVLARELTKSFESVYKGSAAELVDFLQLDDNHTRGEFVVMIKGYESDDQGIALEALSSLKILVEELPLKKAAALTAKIYGLKKNALYQWGLENGL